MSQFCAVLDVGKTNVKIHVIDEGYNSRFCGSRRNVVNAQGLYPHYDIDALWQWIRSTLVEIARDFSIDVIAITTHGATAALVRPDAGESGLVAPIMDYEFDGVASEPEYDVIRPPFSETCSPALSAGLNLGRQLFWQQRHCTRAFDQATYILPYPQYWAWRLTGVAVSEVTSWGCHTDLWAPGAHDYSSLVDKLELRAKLPPLGSADAVVGTVSEEMATQTGLSPQCKVIAGLHDSNASYLRYLEWGRERSFIVISTGTWVVSFSAGTPLASLDENRDMLTNVDVNGDPVPCARFMGGREFEEICRRTGVKPEHPFSVEDLQRLIDQQVFALPDFSGGSGPFGGAAPRIIGQVANGAALATLYCALMIDFELQLLGSEGDIIVEGAWLRNPLLCSLIAQLHLDQRVLLSEDETGTVSGAAQLAFGRAGTLPTLSSVQPSRLAGLGEYRLRWLDQLEVKW